MSRAFLAAMECALAIQSCHGCGHKLRIPDGKRGTVTCPLCGAQWFHPKTIELSDVEFRCSKSGARFNVISPRKSPLHKFAVQQIERAQPGTKSPLMTESNSSSKRPARNPSKAGGRLARIAGRKTDVIPSVPPADLREDQTVSATTAVAMHDANEYNWSGFCCAVRCARPAAGWRPVAARGLSSGPWRRPVHVPSSVATSPARLTASVVR
jgi:hypothetical protein